MSELVPTQGVRVLLVRASIDDAGATYRVELHAPDASWTGEARLAAAITIGPWTATRGAAPEPEPWMIESARGFLRTLAKNHAAERDWPPRLLRWRDRR